MGKRLCENPLFLEGCNIGSGEAWEIAKQLCSVKPNILHKIFGTTNLGFIMKNYKPQEVFIRLEAYKTPDVGDIVCSTITGAKGLVLLVNDNQHQCYVLFKDGSARKVSVSEIYKTDNSVDVNDIKELLNKIQ